MRRYPHPDHRGRFEGRALAELPAWPHAADIIRAARVGTVRLSRVTHGFVPAMVNVDPAAFVSRETRVRAESQPAT